MIIGKYICLIGALIITQLVVFPSSTRAELLCDGKVIPYGTQCCKGGRYCPANHICTQDNRCLPHNSPRVCGGGKYCEQGFVCAPEGGCLKVEAPRYCGDKKFCGKDEACIDKGTHCIKLSSPRFCGINGGKTEYCKKGYHCAGDKCAPDHVNIPNVGSSSGGGNPGGGSSNGSGKIASGCLKVGESKRVGGLIGECTKKDGSTGHWYFTQVSSSMAEGCPKSIEFDYLDTDESKVESFYTPFKVQTCDAPPAAIDVK